MFWDSFLPSERPSINSKLLNESPMIRTWQMQHYSQGFIWKYCKFSGFSVLSSFSTLAISLLKSSCVCFQPRTWVLNLSFYSFQVPKNEIFKPSCIEIPSIKGQIHDIFGLSLRNPNLMGQAIVENHTSYLLLWGSDKTYSYFFWDEHLFFQLFFEVHYQEILLNVCIHLYVCIMDMNGYVNGFTWV